MEEEDKIVMHYKMLEYLFVKCRLATSCFNHAWETFLKENPEYQDLLNESELKCIFWTEIAPNIHQYGLLTEEQEEYFNHDGLILDLSDENLNFTLQTNEPQKDQDYVYSKSEDNFRNVGQRARITTQSIEKLFDKPNVCADDNNVKLNIIDSKLPMEESSTVVDEIQLKSLLLALCTETDGSASNKLIDAESSTRLMIPEIFTDTDHLGMFSNCLLKIIQNTSPHNNDSNVFGEIPSMRTTQENLNPSQSNESIASRSSLSILVPDLSRTPTRSFTRSLSQATPSSQTRRSALQISKSSTPGRSTRSRKALVPEPALNLKMSKFMEKHERRNK